MTRGGRDLARAGVAGGIGGLLNATLCYLGLPLPVPDITLRWHVVPAGAAHGAVLALVALAAARWARGKPAVLRWGVSPVVGWVAGYLSWITLAMATSEGSPWTVLAWPWYLDRLSEALWAPFLSFGGVAAVLYLWLCHSSESRWAWPNMLAASLAGIAGSLWWWNAWEAPALSPLHGAIWGCLVGLAIRRRETS